MPSLSYMIYSCPQDSPEFFQLLLSDCQCPGTCDNTKQEICPFPTGLQLPLNSSTSVGHSRGKWKLATVEKKEAEFQGNRDEWAARQRICMTYRKMQRPKSWQHQNYRSYGRRSWGTMLGTGKRIRKQEVKRWEINNEMRISTSRYLGLFI